MYFKQLIRNNWEASEIGQVKVLAVKCDDLNLIPGPT